MQVQTPLSMSLQESLSERASALNALEGAPFDEPSQSQHHVLDVRKRACPSETSLPSATTASRNEESAWERVEQQDDDDNDENDFMLHNKYLDSLKLLKKNKIVIDRLTKRLSLMEKETSSIASELDAIERKISPMLSLHVASYESSCSHNEDNATTVTCTSTTLSKTPSPDQDFPRQEQASAHRYMHLSDEYNQGECAFLDDIETLSALFCSDLSSISKCLSESGVYDKRMRCHSVDAFHEDELLCNNNIAQVISLEAPDDDLSELSGLSAIPHQEDDNHRLSTSIIGSFVSSRAEEMDDNDEILLTNFGNESTATFEQTGQKSHLYAFPQDLCCLVKEPSQNIAIPASEYDDEDSPPCFILGIKNRNQEDECGCIIC